MQDQNASTRRANLQARCEAQRLTLAEQTAAIEQRLHGTDTVLGSVRKVLSSSTVLAGSLALLLTAGRSGWVNTQPWCSVVHHCAAGVSGVQAEMT